MKIFKTINKGDVIGIKKTSKGFEFYRGIERIFNRGSKMHKFETEPYRTVKSEKIAGVMLKKDLKK